MEWKEKPTENRWELLDSGDVAAAIMLIDKEGITNCFQVKTIISAIYLGKSRFNKLDKHNRDWFSSRRKFPSAEKRDRYVEAKKRELMKYIQLRIS